MQIHSRQVNTMTNALSLYLDALRFGAAFTVFLSHFGRVSGGLFWQMQPYGRTAVLVFFVLSGFVIAWVTEAKERTLEEYALSRAARLYSVILPALIITAVLDHIAMAIDPSLYGPEPLPAMLRGSLNIFLGYVLSLVFLAQSWTLGMPPGSDLPYGTLDYEAWYYILFGVAIFLRGRRRIVALAVAALLAGPPILLFLPLWLMGVSAWRWRAALPRQQAALLGLGALAGFTGLELLGGQQLFQHPQAALLPWEFFGLRLHCQRARCPLYRRSCQHSAADAWSGRGASDPGSRWNDIRALSAALPAFALLRDCGPRPRQPPDASDARIRAYPRGGARSLACDRAAERGTETRPALGARTGAQKAPPHLSLDLIEEIALPGYLLTQPLTVRRIWQAGTIQKAGRSLGGVASNSASS